MRHTIIDASQLELEEKVVSIKRVTKVVKGGRTMRFTALVVVGDGNGHVGAGLGKAAEIPEAIRKGKEDAIKKLVTVARDENNSITHDYVGKFGSAELLMKRAPEDGKPTRIDQSQNNPLNRSHQHVQQPSDCRWTWKYQVALASDSL